MNKLILTLLSFVQFTFCNAQTWTQLADFPGTQRDDGTVFVVNNKAYCLSGLEVGWQCTGNGYSFDGVSETWSPIASLPNGKERQYATAFSYNGNGYLIGGLNCSGLSLKDFWQFSVLTNSWSALSDFPGQGRQGMSNFIINDKLYIIGGRIADNSTINEVWQFDFTTSIWTQKNNLPFAGIWRGAAFSIDTIGYVCYGMINSTSPSSFNHLMYQYNYVTDTWTILPNIVLPARNYIACAVTDKKACLYGGQDSLNVITNDIKLFNPIDTSLTTYVGLPTIGRKGTMAFELNDVFYISTGLDASQNRIKETWKNDAFVGFKELDDYSNLKIYPNPSDEKIYVDLSNRNITSIKLINQLGQIVFEAIVEKQNVEINTRQYNSGIYYLSVQSQDLSVTKKVIISN